MPVSDCVIRRFAHLFVHLHGDEALQKAGAMMVQLRGKGDQDGADTWLQIAIEISAMASVATGATDLKTSGLLPPSQPAHDIELPREMPRKRRHQSR